MSRRSLLEVLHNEQPLAVLPRIRGQMIAMLKLRDTSHIKALPSSQYPRDNGDQLTVRVVLMDGLIISSAAGRIGPELDNGAPSRYITVVPMMI